MLRPLYMRPSSSVLHGLPSFGSLGGNGALGSRFSRCIKSRAFASFFSNSCVTELSLTPASLASEHLTRHLVVV
jgi:hypothetical protein